MASLLVMRRSNEVVLDRLETGKDKEKFKSPKYQFEQDLWLWLNTAIGEARGYELGRDHPYALRTLRSILQDSDMIYAHKLYQQSKQYRRVPLDLLAAICEDEGTVTQQGAAVAVLAAQFAIIDRDRKQVARAIGMDKPTATPFKYVELAYERFTKLYLPAPNCRSVKSMANKYCGPGVYDWQDLLTQRERWRFNSCLRYWVHWRFALKRTPKAKRETRNGIPVGKRRSSAKSKNGERAAPV